MDDVADTTAVQPATVPFRGGLAVLVGALIACGDAVVGAFVGRTAAIGGDRWAWPLLSLAVVTCSAVVASTAPRARFATAAAWLVVVTFGVVAAWNLGVHLGTTG